MRVSARKSSNTPLPKRDQLLNERTRAAALGHVFPDVGHLSIELVFQNLSAQPRPSPQLHTLYPAAATFFRFACPCADCDGDFDLTDAVTVLVKGNAGRKRSASSSGQLSCQGIRLRDRPGNKACAMQLSFQLVSTPRSSA
jgi:hypothetical protein